MITKELKLVKKCCLYASDFHLEMILLPYIKERINKSKFLIITQNDLSNTIKILLDRVNIDKKQKEEILKLSWEECSKEDTKKIIKLIDKNVNLIINGDFNYVKEINNILNSYSLDNINIIDCFNINDKYLKSIDIKSCYKEVLNTNKI